MHERLRHSIHNAKEPSPREICSSFTYVREAAKCGKTDFELKNRFGKRKLFATGLYMIKNDRPINNLSAELLNISNITSVYYDFDHFFDAFFLGIQRHVASVTWAKRFLSIACFSSVEYDKYLAQFFTCLRSSWRSQQSFGE